MKKLLPYHFHAYSPAKEAHGIYQSSLCPRRYIWIHLQYTPEKKKKLIFQPSGCFQKYWYPKMDGEISWKSVLKWKIFGYPYLGDLRSPWLLTTYKSWDDPPSISPQLRIFKAISFIGLFTTPFTTGQLAHLVNVKIGVCLDSQNTY